MAFMSPHPAEAAQASLNWDAPTNSDGTPITDLAGYKLYTGNGSRSYQQSVDVGNLTNYTLDSLNDGTTYYFAATAYDTAGMESGFSNEVSKTYPAVQVTHLITATAGGGGTITALNNSNINQASNGTTTVTSVTVNDSASQAFSIAAAVGYRITGVVIDGVSIGAVASYSFVNVIANHTIAATFALNSYTITASTGAGGSITPTGITTLNYGVSQSYSIVAVTGYRISDVKVDGISVGSVALYYFANVSANHTISATFALNSYTITASAGSGGSITPVGTATLNYGANQVYSIAAATGYGISDVKVDGVSIGVVTSYSFVNVIANHTIAVTFAFNSYTITASAGAGGGITPTGIATFNYGISQSYSIVAVTGYRISDVKVDGISIGAVASYNFANVSANHTIAATFTPNNYTLSASAGAGGSITPVGTATLNYGANQVYSIVAATGYGISDVKVDGISIGAVASYNFANVIANHTISATFALSSYTITASAGAGGGITPVGTAALNYGANQAYSIAAATGYGISDVKVDGVSIGPVTSYSFVNVIANHTISVTFALNSYTITASAGAGGSITPTGTATLNYGANQAYSIAAATGYGISDVKVDGVSIGPVTSYSFVNVIANHTIIATFTLNSYTIMASAGAGGSITPVGTATLNYGANQAYSILAATGYRITDVKVDGVSVGSVASYNFANVSANHIITATFILNSYTISASAGAGGSITPVGVTTLNYGTGQSYVIVAATGYGISDVKVDGISVGAVSSYYFGNISASHLIIATFAAKTYSISASANVNGTISPAGSTTVDSGGSQTYSLTPASGYSIAGVMVDGVSVGAVTSYSFSSVTANHTIVATFAANTNTYTITATNGSGGNISPAGLSAVNYGGSITFSIKPATGYKIAGVSVDGVSVGAVTSYAFSNVTANHTIVATFAINTYTVSASAGIGGTISPAGISVVNYGGSRKLSITPSHGYRVAVVTVDGRSVGAVTSYTFSKVNANHTISATFAVNTHRR